MIDILVNLLFESFFWVGIFILGILIVTGVSALDRRNWKNYSKNYEDFHDDSV